MSVHLAGLLWVLAVAASTGSAKTALEPGLLHEAAVNGDLETLESLLNNATGQQRPSYKGLTTCYSTPTVSNCTSWRCQQLNSSDCISVLQAAAIGWQPAVVDYLITGAGADPNWLNKAGQTALHYAFNSFDVYWHPCEDSFRQTVLILLSNGANPNGRMYDFLFVHNCENLDQTRTY